MYMKLLEQTIKELKGEELEDEVRANVNLRVDLRIDDTLHPRHEPAADGLSPDGRRAHRAGAGSADGRGPRPLRSAAGIGPEPGGIRVDPPARPDRIGLESLDREGQTVVLKFRPDARLDPAVLFRVVKERGGPDA